MVSMVSSELQISIALLIFVAGWLWWRCNHIGKSKLSKDVFEESQKGIDQRFKVVEKDINEVGRKIEKSKTAEDLAKLLEPLKSLGKSKKKP